MKKEYVIFGVIAAIAVYAVSKLRRPDPGVVSSLVPVSVGGTGTAYDSRDPARVSAFTALASYFQGEGMRATRGAELSAGLEAERIRAGAQSEALASRAATESERLGVQRELGLAGIEAGLQQRKLDADTQLAAIDLMGRQAGQQGLQSGVLNAIAAALGALSRSRSGSGAGGGMGGGGIGQPGAGQGQRMRLPHIPIPRGIGPILTPPFFPGWPEPDFPGFGSPGVDLPDLPFGSLPDPLGYYTPYPGYTSPLPESDYPIASPIPGDDWWGGEGGYYGGYDWGGYYDAPVGGYGSGDYYDGGGGYGGGDYFSDYGYGYDFA